jgi:hypothetical protein
MCKKRKDNITGILTNKLRKDLVLENVFMMWLERVVGGGGASSRTVVTDPRWRPPECVGVQYREPGKWSAAYYTSSSPRRKAAPLHTAAAGQ